MDELFDNRAPILSQIVLMIHSGSRVLGHKIATDALQSMEKTMRRDGIKFDDRQLACAIIKSQECQDYLNATAASVTFAWVNPFSMTYSTRKAFARVFKNTPEQLDRKLVLDVSHNIAKVNLLSSTVFKSNYLCT